MPPAIRRPAHGDSQQLVVRAPRYSHPSGLTMPQATACALSAVEGGGQVVRPSLSPAIGPAYRPTNVDKDSYCRWSSA